VLKNQGIGASRTSPTSSTNQEKMRARSHFFVVLALIPHMTADQAKYFKY
jgi:hypothetical protein